MAYFVQPRFFICSLFENTKFCFFWKTILIFFICKIKLKYTYIVLCTRNLNNPLNRSKICQQYLKNTQI